MIFIRAIIILINFIKIITIFILLLSHYPSKLLFLFTRPHVKTISVTVTDNLQGECLILCAGTFSRRTEGKWWKTFIQNCRQKFERILETFYTPSLSSSSSSSSSSCNVSHTENMKTSWLCEIWGSHSGTT